MTLTSLVLSLQAWKAGYWENNPGQATSVAIGVPLIVLVAAALFSLILETVALTFSSFIARSSVSLLLCLGLYLLSLIPLFHLGSRYKQWTIALQARENELSGQKDKPGFNYFQYYRNRFTQETYHHYTRGLDTPEAVRDCRNRLDNPLAMAFQYHLPALAAYGAAFAALVALIVWWRRRTYGKLGPLRPG
jgi:hypothetical protein